GRAPDGGRRPHHRGAEPAGRRPAGTGRGHGGDQGRARHHRVRGGPPPRPGRGRRRGRGPARRPRALGGGDRGRTTLSREALYVYAVLADPGDGAGPRGAGIDGAPLRLVRAAGCGLAALVHEAPAQPYQGPDDDVRRWIRAPDEAVENMRRAAGGVLPMTFNVLVAPGPDGDAETRLRAWLRDRGDDLRRRLGRLRGRAEYRVEITLDSAEVAADDASVLEIEELMRDASTGLRQLPGKQMDAKREAADDVLVDDMHAESTRRLRYCV